MTRQSKTAAETDRLCCGQMMVACRKAALSRSWVFMVALLTKCRWGSLQQNDVQDGANARSEVCIQLLEPVLNGELDPSFVISHTLPLKQAPHGCEIFQQKKDNCIGCTRDRR